MREFILCAAIHYDNGTVYHHQPKNIKKGFVVTGRRHHNCITTISILFPHHKKAKLSGKAQGFITSKDRFVTREQAYTIAVNAGQIRTGDEALTIVGTLYSEHLY